jgi:hypothetical protein
MFKYNLRPKTQPAGQRLINQTHPHPLPVATAATRQVSKFNNSAARLGLSTYHLRSRGPILDSPLAAPNMLNSWYIIIRDSDIIF